MKSIFQGVSIVIPRSKKPIVFCFKVGLVLSKSMFDLIHDHFDSKTHTKLE